MTMNVFLKRYDQDMLYLIKQDENSLFHLNGLKGWKSANMEEANFSVYDLSVLLPMNRSNLEVGKTWEIIPKAMAGVKHNSKYKVFKIGAICYTKFMMQKILYFGPQVYPERDRNPLVCPSAPPSVSLSICYCHGTIVTWADF